jgi:hypothetical protein
MAGTNLVYTVAMDAPGAGGYRTMAKMLAASLLRTQFTGEVLVFRNTAEPLFQVERAGLKEIHLKLPGATDGAALTEQGWAMKYRVRELVQRELDDGGHDKVMFVDCDCLALRNIDTLLEGEDWDLRYYAERGRSMGDRVFNCFLSDEEMRGAAVSTAEREGGGWARLPLRRDGINSGTWAVRAERYFEVMEAWEAIDTGPALQQRQFSEQAAWNRLILNCGASVVPCGTDGGIGLLPWRARLFERDAIQRPLHGDPRWQDHTEASLLHFFGEGTKEKLRCMFGLYMATFFWDETSAFFHLLET